MALPQVTIWPTEGSVVIGSVMGAPLYVFMKYPQSHPFFIPAWGIREMKAKAQKEAKGKGKAAAKAAEAEAPPAEGAAAGKAAEALVQAEAEEEPAAAKELEPVAKAKGKAKAKRAAAAAAAAAPKAMPSLTIIYVDLKLNLKELKTKKGVLFNEMEDSISLRVPCLVPSETQMGKSNVKLERPALPELMTKAAVTEALAKTQRKTNAAATTGTNTSASSSSAGTSKKFPKHMLL